MHTALHNVRTRISLRTLLTFGVAVTLIIVGLLALHTFTAESGTHTVVGASNNVVNADHAAVAVAYGQGQIACDAPCEAAPEKWPPHDDTVMACVLALLAGFLVLVLPRPLLHRTPLVHPHRAGPRNYGARVFPRAPSLAVLSISRT